MRENIKIAQAIIQLIVASVALLGATGLLSLDQQTLAALIGFGAAASSANTAPKKHNGS